MPKSSRAERVQVWTERLRRYRQSELTVAEFCKRECVSTPSFYQWKKRLAAEVQDDVGTGDRFLSLQLVSAVPTPVAFVRLPGGVAVELPSDGSRDQLARLIVSSSPTLRRMRVPTNGRDRTERLSVWR